MDIKDFDLLVLSKLATQQVDQITCLECCKYYIAPETAVCGHTLCHNCWHGRRTCPSCSKPIEKRSLRHNRPIQQLTEHVQTLVETFENLFKLKLDEFLLDTGEMESENDPTKHVKEWLASSQNHFSAPAHSSDKSTQEMQQNPNPFEVSSSKIQIHTDTRKTNSPEKVVHVSIPQDDWEKIEPMPDTEDITKNKVNVVGPMDIEPFDLDENEYTPYNPRRSSRKKDLKPADNINNHSMEKHSSKDSSGEVDKKTNKTKQTWNNVKRMRKEFSKLNKKNRNKLNVSIEMCKKTRSNTKLNVALPQPPSPKIYEIDENTPDNFNAEKQTFKEVDKLNKHENGKEDKNPCENILSKPIAHNHVRVKSHVSKEKNKHAIQNINLNDKAIFQAQRNNQSPSAEIKQPSKYEEYITHQVHEIEKPVRMPFYKKGALYQKCVDEASAIKTINHNIESSTTGNDDIEITIKVNNTITNILIKKKKDVELKVNTDQEIQTSLGPHNIIITDNPHSSDKLTSQNIVINVGESEKVDVDHLPKSHSRVEDIKKVCSSVKSASEKKNTDSADTATVQFEITESVEKELSKVMDQVDVDEQNKTKPTSLDVKTVSQEDKGPNPAANQDGLEYINDMDIFESGSVKESNVQLLKNTEYAPSEILVSTVHTKNRTQKLAEKRHRNTNEENELPKTKKAKLDNYENNFLVNQSVEQEKPNEPESESMNFDCIMGQVFANIDADIEEIRKSQNIDKSLATSKNKENEIDKANSTTLRDKETQQFIPGTNEKNNTVNVNEYQNQKDSENIFSICVDKDEDNVVPTNEKMPQPNVEDFLTPVMCRNLESSGIIEDDDVEMVNDDSDKSVVEETPQKNTSLSKTKQKSNGTSKEFNQSQTINPSQMIVSSNKKSSKLDNAKSIVNLSDTSIEIKKSKDVTVVEAAKKLTMDTPLNMNKFVDQLKHKSTPVVRKSLNFDTQNMDDVDPEQTLCPTTDVAKTTQEKEFLSKAFEKSPTTPAVRPRSKNLGLRNKQYYVAGSCLTISESAKLKILCSQHKWTYSDKFTQDLTHLVVGVDEEKRSQRSVKYMCALAASKWIISYEWVEKCLQTKEIVNEEPYEALDSTGEPGPMRSRIAAKKLFQGITFFCMEPFSVLDVDTLKGILEAAGGRVVKEAKEVKVADKTTSPCLLLAEPENTQEDRFIYLAMELGIVPVNYEWVLNCLGGYTLGSIQELLLCPVSLLPKATEKWPLELIAREDD